MNTPPPVPARGEALVAAVLRVQRAVAGAETMQRVYELALAGVVDLLAPDAASLRIVDQADPDWILAVADYGCEGLGERWRVRAPVSEGASGRAISTGRMVHTNGFGSSVGRSRLAPPGTRAILGVPVFERGKAIGALVASSFRLESWSPRQRELLSSYAEHISVVLAVARASHDAAQVVTDPLTGLANRPFLLDPSAWSRRASRTRRSGGCWRSSAVSSVRATCWGARCSLRTPSAS